MRRDYFTLDLDNVDGESATQPTIRLDFDGPTTDFEARLADDSDVDISFRYQTPADDADANGVFSVTDRLTGDFVLEVNVDAETIGTLVDAARDFGTARKDSPGCYSLRIDADEETVYRAEKRTLLVYASDGSLRRDHSLIPSGVEL
jgi:hypothetical protein